jgi:hypothetical protein
MNIPRNALAVGIVLATTAWALGPVVAERSRPPVERITLRVCTADTLGEGVPSSALELWPIGWQPLADSVRGADAEGLAALGFPAEAIARVGVDSTWSSVLPEAKRAWIRFVPGEEGFEPVAIAADRSALAGAPTGLTLRGLIGLTIGGVRDTLALRPRLSPSITQVEPMRVRLPAPLAQRHRYTERAAPCRTWSAVTLHAGASGRAWVVGVERLR